MKLLVRKMTISFNSNEVKSMILFLFYHKRGVNWNILLWSYYHLDFSGSVSRVIMSRFWPWYHISRVHSEADQQPGLQAYRGRSSSLPQLSIWGRYQSSRKNNRARAQVLPSFYRNSWKNHRLKTDSPAHGNNSDTHCQKTASGAPDHQYLTNGKIMIPPPEIFGV